MAEKSTQIAAREPQESARRELNRSTGSFSAFDRFADEMDRLFDDFGFGRRSIGRPWRGGWSGSSLTGNALWAPDIEVSHGNNELVVRADLPGLKREDISIDVTDDALTISGERRHEQEGEHEGVYRSERSYGSFCRTIPLPEGTITDQAKASFRDGVLEIRMPAPPESTRARRLEISEGAAERKEKK